MKRINYNIFLWILLALISCKKTTNYQAIHSKIDNEEQISPSEISLIIDYLEETVNNTPDFENQVVDYDDYYKNSYPYAMDFAVYIAMADAAGMLGEEDKKRLQKILKQDDNSSDAFMTNYKGSNEEEVAISLLEAEEVIDTVPMGFSIGENHLNGHMISTNGKKFPFILDFYYDVETNSLKNIRYKNKVSGTTLTLTAILDGEKAQMWGMDGEKEFILEFVGNYPYSGDAWWGKMHQKVELF